MNELVVVIRTYVIVTRKCGGGAFLEMWRWSVSGNVAVERSGAAAQRRRAVLAAGVGS